MYKNQYSRVKVSSIFSLKNAIFLIPYDKKCGDQLQNVPPPYSIIRRGTGANQVWNYRYLHQ